MRITFDGMQWSDGLTPAGTEENGVASDASPYRAPMRELAVDLVSPEREDDLALLEVLHPSLQVEWQRRSAMRSSGIAAALLVGFALWSWVPFAESELGTFAPARIGLLILGAALLLVPVAAWFSLGFTHAWSSESPPPWMPSGKAEVLRDVPLPARVAAADAGRRRTLWTVGAAAVFVALGSGFFGFSGFVATSGVVALLGFAFALGPRAGTRDDS